MPLTAEYLEILKRESAARRILHPDWPSHRPTTTLYEPYKRTIVSETMPIGKAEIFGYCKYCHVSHRDWWRMNWRDYYVEKDGDIDMFLCGRCEHTSEHSHG